MTQENVLQDIRQVSQHDLIQLKEYFKLGLNGMETKLLLHLQNIENIITRQDITIQKGELVSSQDRVQTALLASQLAVLQGQLNLLRWIVGGLVPVTTGLIILVITKLLEGH